MTRHITDAGLRHMNAAAASNLPATVQVEAVFIVRDRSGAELWRTATDKALVDRGGSYTATYEYDPKFERA